MSRDARSTKPLWWSQEVGTAISARQRLFCVSKRNPSEANSAAHISACRQVKRAVRTAKRQKEEVVARSAKSNPKAFYCYVNNRRVCRQPVGPLTGLDGLPEAGEAGMSTLINEYFASVFTHENTANIPPISEPLTVVRLVTAEFPPAKVDGMLRELEVHKSVGPDGIYNRVLKELSGEVSHVLAKIFTKSMATGDVPAAWREANVTAIHKKGDKSNPSNYRPISLTSNVCKTMERMVREVLVNLHRRSWPHRRFTERL